MSLLTNQYFPNDVIVNLKGIPRSQTLSTDSFDTTTYIYSLIHQNTITVEHDQILDRLCKKIDVTKRLCSTYSIDLKQALDKNPIDQKALKALALILIFRSQTNNDLKFLNTAFKIIDKHLGECSKQLMLIAQNVLHEVFL